jgi:hypothetical protein
MGGSEARLVKFNIYPSRLPAVRALMRAVSLSSVRDYTACSGTIWASIFSSCGPLGKATNLCESLSSLLKHEVNNGCHGELLS